MERRVTSHTEEEEMNQRRRLLTLARKGDQKAVEQLFELYQVRVFSGDSLKRKKLPTFPLQKPTNIVPKGSYAPEKKEEKGSAKTSVDGKSLKKTAGPKKQEQKKVAPGGRKAASPKKEKGKMTAVSKVKRDGKQPSSRSTGKPKQSPKQSKEKSPRAHKPVSSKKIKSPKKPVKKK